MSSISKRGYEGDERISKRWCQSLNIDTSGEDFEITSEKSDRDPMETADETQQCNPSGTIIKLALTFFANHFFTEAGKAGMRALSIQQGTTSFTFQDGSRIEIQGINPEISEEPLENFEKIRRIGNIVQFILVQDEQIWINQTQTQKSVIFKAFADISPIINSLRDARSLQ